MHPSNKGKEYPEHGCQEKGDIPRFQKGPGGLLRGGK